MKVVILRSIAKKGGSTRFVLMGRREPMGSDLTAGVLHTPNLLDLGRFRVPGASPQESIKTQGNRTFQEPDREPERFRGPFADRRAADLTSGTCWTYRFAAVQLFTGAVAGGTRCRHRPGITTPGGRPDRAIIGLDKALIDQTLDYSVNTAQPNGPPASKLLLLVLVGTAGTTLRVPVIVTSERSSRVTTRLLGSPRPVDAVLVAKQCP